MEMFIMHKWGIYIQYTYTSTRGHTCMFTVDVYSLSVNKAVILLLMKHPSEAQPPPFPGHLCWQTGWLKKAAACRSTPPTPLVYHPSSFLRFIIMLLPHLLHLHCSVFSFFSFSSVAPPSPLLFHLFFLFLLAPGHPLSLILPLLQSRSSSS